MATPIGKIGEFREDVNAEVLCPRCMRNLLPIGYRGAESRADNATEVCSPCGQDEGMQDFEAGLYRGKARTSVIERIRVEVPAEKVDEVVKYLEERGGATPVQLWPVNPPLTAVDGRRRSG